MINWLISEGKMFLKQTKKGKVNQTNPEFS